MPHGWLLCALLAAAAITTVVAAQSATDVAPCSFNFETVSLTDGDVVFTCAAVRRGMAASFSVPAPLYNGEYLFLILNEGNYSQYRENGQYTCINADCQTPITQAGGSSVNLSSLTYESSGSLARVGAVSLDAAVTNGVAAAAAAAAAVDDETATVYFVFSNAGSHSSTSSGQTLFAVIIAVVLEAGYPESFNALTDQPGMLRYDCARYTLDQAECGSCWAFAAAASASDRLCAVGLEPLAFSGATLSMQTIISCERWGIDTGCDGGEPFIGLAYAARIGLPTCVRNCSAGCLPFLSAGCVEGNDTAHDGCVTCPTRCVAGAPFALTTLSPPRIVTDTDLLGDWFNGTGYQFPLPVFKIQDEILRFGSVTTTFTVFDGFMTYWNRDAASGAVYTNTSGPLLGGHAVRMVGWGVDNGVPYWLCLNQWGMSGAVLDGVAGFFKVPLGSNFVNIEANVVVAYPNGKDPRPRATRKLAADAALAGQHVRDGSPLAGGWVDHAELIGADASVAEVSRRVRFCVHHALAASGAELRKILAVHTKVVNGVVGRVRVLGSRLADGVQLEYECVRGVCQSA